MNKQTITEYKKFRKLGYSASNSLHNAKAVIAFEELESQGVVRIAAEYEQEDYFSVYGKPDSAKEYKAICDLLESKGCWYVFTQVKCICCEQWITVDAIGMIIEDNPTSPYENCYAPDLMNEAVRHYREGIH